jgi:hypothetical protein
MRLFISIYLFRQFFSNYKNKPLLHFRKVSIHTLAVVNDTLWGRITKPLHENTLSIGADVAVTDKYLKPSSQREGYRCFFKKSRFGWSLFSRKKSSDSDKTACLRDWKRTSRDNATATMTQVSAWMIMFLILILEYTPLEYESSTSTGPLSTSMSTSTTKTVLEYEYVLVLGQLWFWWDEKQICLIKHAAENPVYSKRWVCGRETWRLPSVDVRYCLNKVKIERLNRN